ncbi:MAG: hypothetical protein ABSB79_04715 [Syntrophales bacterium]
MLKKRKGEEEIRKVRPVVAHQYIVPSVEADPCVHIREHNDEEAKTLEQNKAGKDPQAQCQQSI